MHHQITFIVPAYNVEAYLAECLASIVAACEPGDQIVVVDDGSRDGTNQICRDWQARHPVLIELIEQPNQGLSAARNHGLKLARNSYVLFMDSDDVVRPEAVAHARKVLREHQPDILTMDFSWWYQQEGGRKSPSPACSHPSCTLLTDPTSFLVQTYRDGLLSACSRMFRTSLLRDLGATVFPVGKAYEEIATVPRLVMRARTLYYLNEPLFLYRVRAGSITQTKTIKHCLDLANAMALSNQELARHVPNETAKVGANIATARFVAKALQDCAWIPGANKETFAQTLAAGRAALTIPPDELTSLLKASDWDSAGKAAKHLTSASRHPVLYANSRMLLQRWKQMRTR